MRRHSKISGMTIVSCDHAYEVRYPGEGVCGEQFRSCSDKNVIPKQLELARWGTRDVLRKGIKVTEDLCPHHDEIDKKRASSVARYATRDSS